MPICDGCGALADDEHIRRRIERLELATRFRPIHISVLLIDAAPSVRQEDFLYVLCGDRARSAEGRAYFKELAKLAHADPGAGRAELEQTEATLHEFQRGGFFLASAVECAVEGPAELTAAVRRLAPTVVRRVQTSYQPRHVALISAATGELVEPLRTAGWGERLILDHGAPFEGQRFGERLSRALPRAG